MANFTRVVVIEPTWAEAEKLHDAIDGDDPLANIIRGQFFSVLQDWPDNGADADAPAPISVTVTLREAG